jgi:hypothetical protein
MLLKNTSQWIGSAVSHREFFQQNVKVLHRVQAPMKSGFPPRKSQLQYGPRCAPNHKLCIKTAGPGFIGLARAADDSPASRLVILSNCRCSRSASNISFSIPPGRCQVSSRQWLCGPSACIVVDARTLRLPLMRCPTRFRTISMVLKPASSESLASRLVIFACGKVAVNALLVALRVISRGECSELCFWKAGGHHEIGHKCDNARWPIGIRLCCR